jgi:hypothetical protein
MRLGFVNGLARTKRLASPAVDTGFDDFQSHDGGLPPCLPKDITHHESTIHAMYILLNFMNFIAIGLWQTGQSPGRCLSENLQSARTLRSLAKSQEVAMGNRLSG